MSQKRTSLTLKQMQQVVLAQEKVSKIVSNHKRFENPFCDARDTHPTRNLALYFETDAERHFFKKARSRLLVSMIGWSAVGVAVPCLIMKVNPSRSLSWTQINGVCLGGISGSAFGLASARINLATDFSQLKDSPLAFEARYQLWKMNTEHPMLRGFEDETSRWDKANVSKINQLRNSRRNEFREDRRPSSWEQKGEMHLWHAGETQSKWLHSEREKNHLSYDENREVRRPAAWNQDGELQVVYDRESEQK